MNPIRTLKANEIECRVAQIKENGVQLLLYKDARCDMAILDETFGAMNWKREHTRDNNNCIVSIWDADKAQWVSKEDVGTESNTEAAKGLASDSFKRACVNWGIGRELYTAPFIWVNAAKGVCEINTERQKPRCFDRFEVAEIEYDDNREICRLFIINAKSGKTAFNWRKTSKAPARVEPEPEPEYDAVSQARANDLNIPTENTPTCDRCQMVVTGWVGDDGKRYSATAVFKRSQKLFGANYCMDCQRALEAKNAERTAG